MRVKILKSFPFYPDGNTRREAVAGTDDDIPDALAAGLSAAGYIEPAPPPEKPKAKPVKEEISPAIQLAPPQSEPAKTAAASQVAPTPAPIRREPIGAPLPARGK